jgi:metal-responsive CopG/Arc/MetJ family transcriptional regulator
MATPDTKKMVHMRLEATLLRRLDDFRFKYRFESRSETARWLLEWALSNKPVPPKGE